MGDRGGGGRYEPVAGQSTGSLERRELRELLELLEGPRRESRHRKTLSVESAIKIAANTDPVVGWATAYLKTQDFVSLHAEVVEADKLEIAVVEGRGD